MNGFYGKKLKDTYEDVQEFSFYVIKGRPVIGKKDLASALGKSVNMIDKYEKKGLKRSKYAINRVPIYDFLYSLGWYTDEIDSSHHESNTEIGDLEEDVKAIMEHAKKYDAIPKRYLPEDELDRRIKVTKERTEQMKLDEMAGRLKTTDELKKTLVSWTVTLVATLKSTYKALPLAVEPFLDKDYTKQDISPIVGDLLENTINNLKEATTKDYDNNFYEIMSKVLELQNKNIDVMKLLNE